MNDLKIIKTFTVKAPGKGECRVSYLSLTRKVMQEADGLADYTIEGKNGEVCTSRNGMYSGLFYQPHKSSYTAQQITSSEHLWETIHAKQKKEKKSERDKVTLSLSLSNINKQDDAFYYNSSDDNEGL